MNIVAIIQARMGSSRLPAKVLSDLCGEPVLHRVVTRVQRASLPDRVVVATTDQPLDDAVVDICKLHGWNFCRGSEHDVLNRYYQAASATRADAVVRITADCPLIEPEIIDRVVSEYIKQKHIVDYVSNVYPARTFPRGLDVEVFSFEALVRAEYEDKNPAWREHVTVYLQRHPELFTSRNVTYHTDYSEMRWTVDTLEDLTFVRHIYDYFGHDKFNWQDVLTLLDEHREWQEINCHVKQVEVEELGVGSIV